MRELTAKEIQEVSGGFWNEIESTVISGIHTLESWGMSAYNWWENVTSVNIGSFSGHIGVKLNPTRVTLNGTF